MKGGQGEGERERERSRDRRRGKKGREKGIKEEGGREKGGQRKKIRKKSRHREGGVIRLKLNSKLMKEPGLEVFVSQFLGETDTAHPYLTPPEVCRNSDRISELEVLIGTSHGLPYPCKDCTYRISMWPKGYVAKSTLCLYKNCSDPGKHLCTSSAVPEKSFLSFSFYYSCT